MTTESADLDAVNAKLAAQIAALKAEMNTVQARIAAAQAKNKELVAEEEQRPYRVFVDPTMAMCDECGCVREQQEIRPRRWSTDWPMLLLCKPCRAKLDRRQEPMRAYTLLVPNQEQFPPSVMRYYNMVANTQDEGRVKYTVPYEK